MGTPGSDKVTVDPRPFDELRVFAECFEDAQKARIAVENRLRSGTVPATIAGPILEGLERSEHQIALAMRRSFRRAAPAIRAWTVATPGLGEHLMARLLGTIGHPVIAWPHHWEGENGSRVLVADDPYVRSVSQLWSYCGHGDPTRKRRVGMTQDDALRLGNPRAKVLIRLLAESCMKCTGGSANPCASPAVSPIVGAHPNIGSPAIEDSIPTSTTPGPVHSGEADGARPSSSPMSPSRRRSPYRDVYDLARTRYADRDDWTDAHKHSAALRLTGKRILADLYDIAKTDLAVAP